MPSGRAFALSAVCVCVLAGCGGKSEPAPAPAAPSPPAFVITNLDEMLSEKTLGSAMAPIVVVGYASLTSPASAAFHLETLPQLKRSYIDTGQVRFIYRDFPVPGVATTAAATAAAALARCAGNDRYFDALGLIYVAQGTWSASTSVFATLKQVVASLGMPAEKMDACLASAELQAGIGRQKDEGLSAGVGEVPTVVINGQRITDTSFARLAAVLQPLTPSPATCRGSCHRPE